MSATSKTIFVSSKTTESHLDDVDFYRCARIASRIFGIWPLHRGSKPIRFYVNIISLCIAAVIGMAHGFVNLDNLYLALDSWCGAMFEFVSGCKALFVWYHYDLCTSVLQQMYVYYRQDYDQAANALYRKAIKYSTFATVVLGSGGLNTCNIYVFTPIIKNIFYYLTGQPFVREQPFKAVYPFIDSYSDDFFLWCYIHLSHGGYCTAIVFIGIDSIFMTTCFHISTQFKIISLRIENAFAELADKHYLTPAQNELMRQRLRDIVISQTKLMEITESFIRVFTGIILVHFISVALIIGIGSINLLTTPGTGKILYFVYIMTVVIQLYAYAYCGTQVAENSFNLCKVCYNVNWILIDSVNRKMIQTMIMRSQRAVMIKVPFFEVSLMAYSKIMSTAGSYITLLNKMLSE